MILELYSKRQRVSRGDVPDVYQYNSIPEPLRVQVIHIWKDSFGHIEYAYGGNDAGEAFKWIHDALCREYGLFKLSSRGEDFFECVANFLMGCNDTERVIDVIELSFRVIDTVVRTDPQNYNGAGLSPDEAIAELNARFREQGVGYEYQAGKLIRVDSKFLHAKATKPALQLLSSPKFKGANDEFLKAFDHYRQGRYKEVLNDCLKAFESTLKTICKHRRWRVDDSATAKTLIDVCLSHELLPSFLQTQFSALRAILESGIPTGRNKLSGHGQGAEPITVPRYFASYILHLTATTILLFIEAHEGDECTTRTKK